MPKLDTSLTDRRDWPAAKSSESHQTRMCPTTVDQRKEIHWKVSKPQVEAISASKPQLPLPQSAVEQIVGICQLLLSLSLSSFTAEAAVKSSQRSSQQSVKGQGQPELWSDDGNGQD